MTSVLASVTGGLTLNLVDAEVTLDEAWAPFGQATMETVLPPAWQLAQIDPRWNDLRLNLTLTDGEEVRSFDLGVRSRTVNHKDARMVLTAATDEAVLQDFALVSTSPYSPGETFARTVVAFALSRIGATLQPGSADALIDGEASQWLPGVSAWDYLEPIIQASSLRLWCDEQRRWWLEPDAGMSNGWADLTYSGTVKAVEDEISRDTDDWYDAVVVHYSWTDAEGLDHESWDTATMPGYRKVLTLAYETKPPASGAARRVLGRAQGRGRAMSVRAISDLGVTPTMPSTITMPVGTPVQSGVVSAVTWRPATEEMEIRTRGLVDVEPASWAAVPGGVSWESIPPGVSWTDFVDLDEPTPWNTVPTGQAWADLPFGTSWNDYTQGA